MHKKCDLFRPQCCHNVLAVRLWSASKHSHNILSVRKMQDANLDSNLVCRKTMTKRDASDRWLHWRHRSADQSEGRGGDSLNFT